MEDEIMRRFGSDKVKGMLSKLGFDDEQSIRSNFFSKSIESAQRRVEGNNFDTRKQLLQYDNVMSKQREIVYKKRNEILDNESIHETVVETFKNYIYAITFDRLDEHDQFTEIALRELQENVNNNLLVKSHIALADIEDKTPEEVVEIISELVIADYEEKVSDVPKEVTAEFEKAISLNVIDTNWMEHINTMDQLKEGIHLRGYAQVNPVQAYTLEGFELFDGLLDKIDATIAEYLIRAEIRQNIERKVVEKNVKTNDSESETKKKPATVNKKPGRNEACPCGSGKKYKQCCGKN